MSVWDNPNAPYFLALQVCPALATGSTGVGKSSIMASLARALNRRFVLLVGSTHAPEDFSGLPIPDYDNGVVRMMPTAWAQLAGEPNCFVLIDEITTVQSATRAAMLSLLTERRVGDTTLHPDTIICGACNPPSLAPNATPLEKSMANRFFHHQWEMPFDDWAAGLTNADSPFTWPAPEFPLVSPDWRLHSGKYGVLVAGFLRKNPKLREVVPDNDEQLAFPTYRSWTNVGLCLAAAASVNAPPSIQLALTRGNVGESAATEFMQYLTALDLVDPEDVLEGRVKFAHNDERPDLTACLTASLVTALASNNSPDRWSRAANTLLDISEQNLELTIYHFKKLLALTPANFSVPTELTQRMFKQISRVA